MTEELTHKQVARNGGLKRWKGKTAKERKEEMKKVWSKRMKKVPVDKSLASEVAQ